MDDDDEDEWRDGDDNESIDSEGKPHETYHYRFKEYLNVTYKPLCAKGELDDDDEAGRRDGNDEKHIDSEGKLHKTYGDSQHRNSQLN